MLDRIEGAANAQGLPDLPPQSITFKNIPPVCFEIDKNINRGDLTVFEQAQWLKDRKKIYIELHPETKAGLAGAIAKHANADSALAETPSFVDSTAALTGDSNRVISENIQIATELEDLAGLQFYDT